jgi:glyoxylase-like metal-dependent hydrolase (beta-lactamase superfamily II)
MRIAEEVYLIASGALGTGDTHACDCNVYAVRCGSEYALIDSGVGIASNQLATNLKADGISEPSVRHLLLTHKHLDHSGGARWFRDSFGLEVYGSAQTAAALESGDEEAISLAAAKRAGIYSQDTEFRACKVDRRIADGETWVLGDTTIQAISTPGHSEDMLSYVVQKPDRTLLFSGDAVFHGGRVLISDVYDCDVPAYGRSLRTLAKISIDALFPGHGMWTVRGGGAHLAKAVEYLDKLLLPPNLI